MGDTVAEVEAVKLGEAQGDAHALVDTLADTLAVVEAVTLGDARDNAYALVELWLISSQWWRH